MAKKLTSNTNKEIPNQEKAFDFEVSPRAKSLKGVIKVPDDYDYKSELERELVKKYLM